MKETTIRSSDMEDPLLKVLPPSGRQDANEKQGEASSTSACTSRYCHCSDRARATPWWDQSLSFAVSLICFVAAISCLVMLLLQSPSTNGTVRPVSPSDSSPCLSTTLPLRDVNVLVVTDVHSWVASHSYHEPYYDVDYGHVLSFYEHLASICRRQHRDLFFVMNGDFVDGTGLSTYPPSALIPILGHMPWDAVNIGNHELYRDDTVRYMIQPGGFVDWFGDRYLSSNVRLTQTNQPLGGNKYRFLRGTFTNSTLLTFGFLYNMKDSSSLVTVRDVQHIVQTPWFTRVLKGQHGHFNAILVLAHMDLQHPLITVLLSAIRDICGHDMPVQFIAGHTHYRGYRVLDAHSTSFEAGRYLDTIGFVSFSPKEDHDSRSFLNGNAQAITNTDTNTDINTNRFDHVFIDANVETLKQTLGISDFDTESGMRLSNFIKTTQEQMGISNVIGCSPQTYRLLRPLNETDSLWGLYLNEVIPQQLFHGNTSKVFIQRTTALRYDLFRGNVTVTDVVSVSPFRDSIYLIAPRLCGSLLLQLLDKLNNLMTHIDHDDGDDYNIYDMEQDERILRRHRHHHHHLLGEDVPDYALAGTIIPDNDDTNMHYFYDLYSAQSSVGHVTKVLEDLLGNKSDNNMTLIPVPIDNMNTTSLWMDYVMEEWPCVDTNKLKT